MATATKTANEKKETKRVRLFKLLAKHPNGLTATECRTRLDTNSICDMLRDEATASKPRIRAQEGSPSHGDEVRGRVFSLTAAGRAAIKNETVDSDAPGHSTAADWK